MQVLFILNLATSEENVFVFMNYIISLSLVYLQQTNLIVLTMLSLSCFKFQKYSYSYPPPPMFEGAEGTDHGVVLISMG